MPCRWHSRKPLATIIPVTGIVKSIMYILFLVLPWTATFSQDTIVFNNRAEFGNRIGYLYHDQTSCLSSDLKTKIDSIFFKYDFTGPEYACQYRLSFILDMDSCGYVTNCQSSYLGKDTLSQIDAFGGEVCSMFLNSKMRIKNKVSLKDTSYRINSALYHFETSCEPWEVLYYDEMYPYLKSPPHLLYKEENEEILFDGFKYGCDID